jgi:predicted MPP superfamily phosphohydrolase
MPNRTGWTRRQFLLAGGGLVAAASAGVAADAFALAPHRVAVSRMDFGLSGLAPELDGLRLAQVTDVHLYNGVHRAARRVMEVLAAEQPDVVFFLGDLCERPAELPHLEQVLAACRGRLGTFVTIGNWERQSGITPAMLARTCSAAGADFLFNESRVVRVGGALLVVVGLDDPVLGFPDPDRALSGAPSGAPVIWVHHGPDLEGRLPASTPRPELMLAGHTHGGQIRIPGLPPVLPRGAGRFVAGWYHDTLAPLYVSRGVGTTVIRARFNCPPELPIITLRRHGAGSVAHHHRRSSGLARGHTSSSVSPS